MARSQEAYREAPPLSQSAAETARARSSPAPPGDTSVRVCGSRTIVLGGNRAWGAGRDGTSSLEWGAGRDPRLYAEARLSRHPAYERIETDAQTALRAHQDRMAEEQRQGLAKRQVAILGRRVTVLGDSTAYHRMELRAGRKIVMPSDRREWEDLQMNRQEQDRERDRSIQEQVRATRERRDAEREAGRQPRL